MKHRQLKDGETVMVSDKVLVQTCFGRSVLEVHRTTKTLAIVRYNDVAEGKFPIVYSFLFKPIPRHQWSTTPYKVLRPVIDDATEERRAMEIMDAQDQMQEMRKDSKEVE